MIRSARFAPRSSPIPRAALAIAIALWTGVGASPAAAGEEFAGPVAAEIVRVIDGDTLEVKARVWLGLDVTTRIRIRGIDAPELHGRCQREKDMAATAATRLAEFAGAGGVVLSNISEDKYGGRVDADVATEIGKSLGDLMLASGLVRPYDGGARGGWCGLAGLDPPE